MIDPNPGAGESGLVSTALRGWIRARTGIAIDANNQAPVELAVRLEAERHGIAPTLYLEQLMGGRLPPQAFVDAVTTNESYFFRALDQMRLAVNRLIPDLLRRRPGQPVRLLSLPCARGEEPYSLAILCEEHRLPPGRVEITGADISRRCIDDARRGVYGPLAFRRTDPTTLQRWFSPEGPRDYRLEPTLLPRVKLHRVNLLEDAEAILGGPYDILFCENLLIYFDDETTERALAALGRLLAPDGWLFVDHAEWNIPRARFRMQELDGSVGFRPQGQATALRAGPTPVAPLPSQRVAPTAPPLRPAPAPSTGRQPPPASPTHAPRHPRSNSPAPEPSPPAPTPPAQDHLGRAQAHYRAKRFAEALLAFEAALSKSPAEPRALLGKARVLADCGEDFEALETLESLLQAQGPGAAWVSRGDHAEALALMALLLNKKGLTELASTYLDQLAHAAPDHPVLGLRAATKPQGGTHD